MFCMFIVKPNIVILTFRCFAISQMLCVGHFHRLVQIIALSVIFNVALGKKYELLYDFRNYIETQLNEANFGIDISPDIYMRSVTSTGDKAMMSTMLSALSLGKCLTVTAIGGSVCYGKDTSHLTDTAFPNLLEKLLNQFMPCNGRHLVYNECREAYQSTSFIDFFYGMTPIESSNDTKALSYKAKSPFANFTKHIQESDVVLVDFSVNDGFALGHDPLQYFHEFGAKNVEMLIRLISSLPKFPTILYIGTSTFPNFQWKDRLEYPRLGDVSYFQSEMAKYYHVPYISVVDALGPFDSPEKENFLLNKFMCEKCIVLPHPGDNGHKMISALIMNFIITSHLGNQGLAAYKSSTPNLDHRLPSGKYVKEEQINAILTSQAIFVDLERAKPVNYHGNWTWMADVPRKYGLISHSIGDWITYDIDTSPFPDSTKSVSIHVLVLKSYTRVGVLEIITSCNGKQDPLSLIDLKWEKKTSEVVMVSTEIKLTEGKNANYQITFKNSNILNLSKRELNKIKLVRLVFFPSLI